MGRTPICSKDGFNRGAWTSLEDKMLTDYVSLHGEGKWSHVAKRTGLKRCGKSCRLRWLNYLRPDIKRGNISRDEEELIVRLHKLLGNRWSLIAGRLPGRTDNEIKNYWNSNLAKKIEQFQLSLPKLTQINTNTPPPPTSTPVTGSEDDRNPEAIEPAGWPSGDDEINPPDFLLDFNIEDFCHILDPPNNNTNKNNDGREEEDDEEEEEMTAEIAGVKYWDGNDKCGDQSDNHLINGSDFMSDLDPFFDSYQVLDWSGMA